MAVAELKIAVKAEDVKELPYVDESKFYYVDLQFGSQASWRIYQGRPRAVIPRGNGTYEAVHDPKIERHVGPLSGSETNGLIAGHNDWLKSYKRRKDSDYRGQADRQLLVLGTEETNNVPRSLSAPGMVPISMVERIVEEKLQAALGGVN